MGSDLTHSSVPPPAPESAARAQMRDFEDLSAPRPPAFQQQVVVGCARGPRLHGRCSRGFSGLGGLEVSGVLCQLKEGEGLRHCQPRGGGLAVATLAGRSLPSLWWQVPAQK